MSANTSSLTPSAAAFAATRTQPPENGEVRDFGGAKRWWQWPAAVLLAATSIVYTGVWMYCVRTQPLAVQGFDFERSERAGTITVTALHDATAAAAGLRSGDIIAAVNGYPLRTLNPFYDAVTRGNPGDVVAFQVRRPGAAPLRLQYRLREDEHRRPNFTLAQRIAFEALGSYQVPFLIVGLGVLFSQHRNRHAWMMALMFCGFIASAPLLIFEGRMPSGLRGMNVAYMSIFNGCGPALFYYFLATFPVRSPLDRKAPWLKTVVLGCAAAVTIPLAAWCLMEGGSHPLSLVFEWLQRYRAVLIVVIAYSYAMFALGMAAMLWTAVRAPTPEVRRKTRVMVYGTFAAVIPFLLLTFVGMLTNTPYYQFPFWVWVPTAFACSLMPIAIAYVVVKHRVLEIPILLKRSARYFLVQRGFVLLHMAVSIAVTVAIALLVAGYMGGGRHWSLPVVLTASVTFGSVLAFSGIRIHRTITQKIDRAFFRSAYDARHILEDLAAKTRSATSREELAALLEAHLRQALHPVSLAVYCERAEERLELMRGVAGPEPAVISAKAPLLTQLAERAQAWEVPPEIADGSPLVHALGAECLVPILGLREGHLQGMLALGPRLSEEAYSGEDRRLLTSVASQAGTVLRSICLAEQMATRIEAERRAAHEIEMAREVQRKLLPQKQPHLATLDYAGQCLQARVVGGDYYDFLELAPGQVGFVLADIAGKGFAAALLMANLQANLRSQFPLAMQDLPALLRSVNRLFYDNTEPSHYATFFFARYDDREGKLCYANCGHNPPLLVHSNGGVERLTATATVLGLFPEWDCTVSEVRLVLGDALVMYTDGVTEAENASGEEFGVARLAEEIRKAPGLPASGLLDRVVSAVKNFSAGEQGDDITLVIARYRQAANELA